MNKVKYLWRIYHFNNELTLEFQSLSKIIFSKLKSCQEILNVREKNLILENDINTEFQTILFDFLYEEQELYEYYDELFEQKKYIPKNKNIPFNSFITNYQNLYLDFLNDKKKINRLKKLRWYLIFDEDNFLSFSPSTIFCFYENEEENDNNNINIINESNMINNSNNIDTLGNFNLNLSLIASDSFNEKEKDKIYQKFVNNNESLNIKIELKEYKETPINEDIINNLINKEENPLLYIVKLISITMTLFCRETMCHLNIIYNEDNSEDLIKEYIKRFNNFVIASKYINSKCENINLVMNYLDKEFLKNYPHFQKFSVFRLCIKIWYLEMSSILTQDNCSILSKIKKITLKLFSEFIYKDLTNVKRSEINSFLFNSGQTSGSELFLQSKENFNLSKSISLFNSNADNQTLPSTICPFGSYYEISDIKYTIIEKCLGIIYETFSDEYSVYLFNLSNIETNNYYDEIENSIIDIIESNLKKFINNNINNYSIDNNSLNKSFFDMTLNYFKSYFYSQRIINKLKIRIYMTVVSILKNIIFEKIDIKIIELITNKKNMENNIIIEVNLNEKYINEIYNYLTQKKNTTIEIKELKQIIYKIDDIENLFDILLNIDKWLENEIQIIENTNKKVLKELDRNNIPSSYNNLQRYLLSFSVRNNWEIIRKIRTIENYHQKLNIKKEKNINNNNYTKSNINSSIEQDLNNLNHFQIDDLNNFDNTDYLNQLNNLNNINDNNNSNLNNLKNSSIFFN